MIRHSQLLSKKYHGYVLVYEATTGHYPIGYHPTIQPKTISTKRLYIYGNKMGMYGLPQSGKITNDNLKLHISKCGYDPAPITPGLWQYQMLRL